MDLRIFYSCVHKEPTELINQKVYINPERRVILQTPQGRDSFDNEWVYLSFFSLSGCQLILSVSFKDDP